MNQTGQDLIVLGSLTNFTVIDKVPADWKPQYSGGFSTEKGIKVQGGTGATLEIDATTFDNDTLFQVKDADHVEVTDRSDSTVVTGFSYFGTTVSHLVIKTNGLDADNFRGGSFDDRDHGNWVQGEGTNVVVEGLTAGIDVKIDTGTATHDSLILGNNNTITEQVTVLTGAGDDIVNLQDPNPNGGGGDDDCDVIVDFAYASGLGLGNELNIHSAGTARLDNAPGTSNHIEYVDHVRIVGGSIGDRGQLIVQHESTIDDMLIREYGLATLAASGTTVNTVLVHSDANLAATAPAMLGYVTLEGEAFFGAGSANSSIDTLDMNSGNATLDLDGSADVAIETLTNDQTGTINTPNTSTLTIHNATNSGMLNFNLADQGSADVHVTGTFTVTGTVNVNDGILLTVGTFAASSGTVNVNEHANMTVQNASVINNLNVVGTSALATFQSTGTHITNLTITDAGKVTLQAINQAPSVSGTANLHVLIVDNLNFGSFTTPTGKLDLTDGAMIVYSTSSDDVHSLLKSGYNSSQWDGLGINSSKAHDVKVNSSGNTALGHNIASAVPEVNISGTFAGITIDNTSAVIVRYTFYGDMNLDGGVNVTDLGALATNWQTSGPQVQWPEADFNYDNSVDVTDLGLLATNWQQGVNPQSEESFNDAWNRLRGG